MTTQKTLLTADEFYRFCGENDGRYELADGEVIELSPVNDEHGEIAAPPDITVEMVSPSDTAAGIERKVAEYLAVGSRRVWAVYPASRNVTVHRDVGRTITYGGDGVIADGELLPGFALPLADIFE